MRYLTLILILSVTGLTGCSGFSLPNTTGSKTVSEYDDQGNIIKRTQEETPIFDSQYHWTNTQKEVAQSAAKVDIARADNTSKIIKNTQNKAATKTEAVLIGIFGMQALERMKSSIPGALAALGTRPMNGYEAFIGGLHELVGLGPTVGLTIAYTQREKTAREQSKNAGDHIAITGDSNSVSTEKTRTDSVVHANTTGDNSPTNVENNQQASGCPTGDCDEKSEGGAPATGFDVDSCINNPPGGYNAHGDPLWATGESCLSHQHNLNHLQHVSDAAEEGE